MCLKTIQPVYPGCGKYCIRMLGVAQEYQNTPEFDSLMDQIFFNIEKTTDDLTNNKIPVAKRFELSKSKIQMTDYFK